MRLSDYMPAYVPAHQPPVYRATRRLMARQLYRLNRHRRLVPVPIEMAKSIKPVRPVKPVRKAESTVETVEVDKADAARIRKNAAARARRAALKTTVH